MLLQLSSYFVVAEWIFSFIVFLFPRCLVVLLLYLQPRAKALPGPRTEERKGTEQVAKYIFDCSQLFS